MTMKKLTALLLAVAMLLTLVACNTDKTKDNDGDANANPNATTTTESATTTTTGNTTTTTETATTTTTASNEAADQKAFAIGTYTGNTYENSFIGIGCKLDDSWEVTSEEELREMNEIMMEEEPTDYLEALQRIDIVQDMMVQSTNTGASINITLENLEVLYGVETDGMESLDAILSQLKEEMDEVNDMVDKATFMVAGKERQGLAYSINLLGLPLYEAVVCIPLKDYIAVITVIGSSKAEVTDLLAKFYAV